MALVKEALNKLIATRSNIIGTQYIRATTEFNTLTHNYPWWTNYHIYSGCINKEITLELAKRFNEEGVSAEAHRNIFGYYIYITIPYNNITKE